MKIACPNKNTAIYKEIRSKLDQRRTDEIFMKIEQDKFKKWYGKGEFDSFGYPKLEDEYFTNEVGEKISIYEFSNSEKFKISERNRKSRERINNEAKDTKDIIAKMKDVLLTKLRIYKGEKVKFDSKGQRVSSEYSIKIQELINELDTTEEKAGILFFVDNAINEIESSKKRMQKLMDSDNDEIKDFSIIKNYVSAYDILDEARDMLSRDSSIDKSYIDNLDRAIVDRDQLKRDYFREIKKVDAKVLSKFIHNKSEEEIEDEMEVAPFDINGLTQMTMFAGSSADTLLAGTAAMVNDVQANTRKKHILLMHDLNSKIIELEKAKGTTNANKLYDNILEKDKNGKFTGYYVSEYNIGGLENEKNEFYENLNKKFDNGEITLKEKKKLISKWYKENFNEDKSFKDKWKSSQFTELEKNRENGTNKEVVEFYDYFHKAYREMQELIPEYYAMGYKLPSIRKELIERVIQDNITDSVKILKETAKDAFLRQGDETRYGEVINESGNVVNKIPIFFTGNLPVNEMSTDLGHLLGAFSAIAINYDEMSSIIDTLESTREIIKERRVLKTTSTGEKMKNIIKGLNDTNIYTKGEASNVLKHFDNFLKTQVFGQTNDDLGFINLGIVKLDTSKTLDKVTQYTTKNLLALNILNDISNKTLGEITNWIDAGGDLYDSKQYLWAVKEYNSEMLTILGDIGARIPKSKINIISEWLNFHQDYRGSINENKNQTRWKKLLSTNSLFFGMKAGEHGIAAKAGIAALKKIQPLQNGKPIEGLDNMYDAITIIDGKFIIDPRVTNFGNAEQNSFSRKVQETLRTNHGNFSNESAATWQRNAIWRMVGSLRRHLPTGYMKRFGTRRANQFLERDTEGMYLTTIKFLGTMVKDLKELQISLLKEDWNSLEDFEKQNIRKTLKEASMLLITMIAIAGLTRLDPDDDDLDNKTKLLLAYQASRLHSELISYADPLQALKLMRSPAASMGLADGIVKTLHQLVHDPSERYTKGSRKGELKISKDIQQIIPIYRQFRKFTNEGLNSATSWYNATTIRAGN